MSGIVGLVALDGSPVRAGFLQGMVDLLAHRGPDGRAIWHRGSAGLGHSMLQTTPESRYDALPLEHDGLVITADARIDNRGDLIRALGIGGQRSAHLGDSAIILAAYKKWGEACPERILGDFAFCIWDQRRRSLFCARDHFGVRPFYYCQVSGRFFAFASEIKALLCLPDVPRDLNESRIGDYLAAIPSDKVATFFRDINRLQCGHSLAVNPRGVRFKRYWSAHSREELRLSSSQDYAEAYLDAFTQAVNCRMRAAHPVGATLSGGLDSSSVVCIAREFLRQRGNTPLPTFSGIFEDDRAADERLYIDAVVAQGDLSPHNLVVDRLSPLANLEKVLWHLEEPLWAPNLYMHWGLFDLARAQGIRIFLDGYLGDNVVGHGWEYLMDLAYGWRWVRLYRELRGVVEKQRGRTLSGLAWRYFVSFSVGAHLDPFIRQGWQILSNRASDKAPDHAFVNPEFARRIDLSTRLREKEAAQPSPPQAARKRLHNDLNAGEMQLGLETAGKSAAAFQLEDRYPFTDRRLAELSAATPPDQRISDGLSRSIARRALAGRLPEKVRLRTGKGDLSSALQRNLLRFEGPLLDELLLSDPSPIDGYLDIPSIRRSYLSYKEQGVSNNFYTLWAATNLALWKRQPLPPALGS